MEFVTFFRGDMRRIRCDFSLSLTDSMGNVRPKACNIRLAPNGCAGIFNDCDFEPVEVTEDEMHSLTTRACNQYWVMKNIAETIESI
jgi:hypothetical protein